MNATPQPFTRPTTGHVNALSLSEAATDRSLLTAEYQRVRQASTNFSRRLSPEDQMLQAMPEASPNKWHLAHTSWFFETFILQPHLPDYQPLDPAYNQLFNSYYNAIGEQYPRPQRGLLSRPSLEQVLDYRRHVDDAMETWLNHADDGQLAELAQVLVLGLNHEGQHQELMVTDALHGLSHNPLHPAITQPLPAQTMPGAIHWLDFAGGKAAIGASGEDGFALDNEQPRHSVWLHDYQLANRL
ncbi:MAG TPA: ergothioneine biosynthesis protein EgtB, partial [Chromatiales bacterium]|nr:ergothioneine biosynthesis protein EgtB [Chromatiales bacterium]